MCENISIFYSVMYFAFRSVPVEICEFTTGHRPPHVHPLALPLWKISKHKNDPVNDYIDTHLAHKWSFSVHNKHLLCQNSFQRQCESNEIKNIRAQAARSLFFPPESLTNLDELDHTITLMWAVLSAYFQLMSLVFVLLPLFGDFWGLVYQRWKKRVIFAPTLLRNSCPVFSRAVTVVIRFKACWGSHSVNPQHMWLVS